MITSGMTLALALVLATLAACGAPIKIHQRTHRHRIRAVTTSGVVGMASPLDESAGDPVPAQ
jgi:hypothetical protein